MLSLVTDILPIAPGVRATTPARRVSHLSLKPGTDARVEGGPRPTPATAGRLGSAATPLALLPRNPRLAQLAEQIRQIQARGRLPAAYCPSGLTELDAGLGGGFLTAAVHELIAAQEGVAACSVALRTAAHAAGGDKWIFYIDTGGDLYPPGVAQLGVPLGRLAVVRTSRVADALWACEQTLRCRAVAAVVLPLRTLDGYTSRRLQLAAETGGSLGLLVRSDDRGEPTFAASRVRLEPLVGPAGGRYMRVTVLKIREGRPREPFVVELPDAPDAVPAHAVPADGAGAARRRTGG